MNLDITRAAGLALCLAALAAPAVPSPAAEPPASPPAAPATGPAAPAAPAAAAPESDGLIQLNFPQTVEVQALVEYVSKRLGINIVYDESLAKTRVNISSPVSIHKDALLGLLASVLDMANMELVDTGQPGWKTIGRKATVRFVLVKHAGAAELAKQVSSVLEERERIAAVTTAARPAAAGGRAPAGAVAAGARTTLVPDARTNQIAVIGTEPATAEAIKLIEAMDVAADMQTRSYRFRYIAPQRIETLMRSRTSAAEPKVPYESAIDETSGLLVVTAPAKVHEQVQALAKELDVESDPSRSFVRFYKLLNTTAEEVLGTIRSLREGEPAAPAGSAKAPQKPSTTTMPEHFTGPNLPPQPALGELPAPPAYHPSKPPAAPATAAATGGPTGRSAEQPAGTEKLTGAMNLLAQNATVTADKNTNTIIVVAPPEVQQVYEQLIKELDRRRPQVLVEVTLVTLDTTNDFSLGVELGGMRTSDDRNMLLFSRFGLSTIDLKTGVPTIIPAAGFNGILVGSDTLNVVVQALAKDSHARVLSAPKVLVNDNATATLASVSEEPFTSVNASDTVSTTSFAGYASAGTTVTMTPHISEGEHLQLRYSVTLNSFTGTSSGPGIPPPRQTNTVSSEVTMPNGFGVIVGGLRRADFSRSTSKVPWLGDIPGLGYLFSLNKNNQAEGTLFVFIRPLILRDDKFEDLRYLSDRDLALAKLPPNAPSSDPLVMP